MVINLEKVRTQAIGVGHKLFRSKATQDSIALYAGNLLAAGIGFIASLIVARKLGPSGFGIVVAYNSIIVTLVGVTDLGLGVGVVKNVAPLLVNGESDTKPYFQFLFLAEVISGLLILIPGFIFSHQLKAFMGSGVSLSTVYISVLAASFASISAYVGITLIAHKKIKLNALMVTFNSSLRLIIVLVLLKRGYISTSNVLYTYTVITVLNLAIGFLIIPKDFIGHFDFHKIKRAAKLILPISGWLTLSSIITAIASRLDFFYLFRLKGPAEAGTYGAALQLSTIFALLITSFSAALIPYVSERVTRKEQILFLKKGLLAASLGAIAILSFTAISPFIINLLFGQRFILAVPVFQILSVHFALNLMLLPVSLIFIPLGKVRYGSYISSFQLIISLILFPILIKSYGSRGAAGTILSTTIVGLIFYVFSLFFLIRRNQYERPIS